MIDFLFLFFHGSMLEKISASYFEIFNINISNIWYKYEIICDTVTWSKTGESRHVTLNLSSR